MAELRILGLCVAAALICATLRAAHPQIAAVVALAAGVVALTLMLPDLQDVADAIRTLSEADGGHSRTRLMKICGVAMLAEFASDICRDAGESALSKRIEVGVKVSLLAGTLPMLGDLMRSVASVLS